MKLRRRIACPQGSGPRRLCGIRAGICNQRNRVQSTIRAAKKQNGPCPLWVKSRHRKKFSQCPLYPQKRTSIHGIRKSALCQKRTFCNAAETALFDHLVGESQHFRGDVEVQCLRRLEVDHQLQFGRLHNRQIGRLGTFQDFAGVNSGQPPWMHSVYARRVHEHRSCGPYSFRGSIREDIL
jgi:hypothetical protein